MDSSETAVESQYNLLHYHHNNYQSHLPLYSQSQQQQQQQQQAQFQMAPLPTETSKDRRLIYRNVIIQNDANGDRVLAENIAKVVDGMDQVYFRVLIVTLRSKNLIEANSSIFFFDVTRDIYVHQGCEATMPDSRIALSRFGADEIRIRFRRAEQRRAVPPPPQQQVLPQMPIMMSDFMVGNQASSLLARRNPMNCFAGAAESNTRLSNGHRHFSNAQGDSYYMSSQEHGAGQNTQFLSDMPCNSDEQSKIFGEEDEDDQDFEADFAVRQQLLLQQHDEDGTFGMTNESTSSFSHPHFQQQSTLNTHQPMLSHQLPSQLQQTTTTMAQQQQQQPSKQIPREKRVKERKIGYVHSRVMEWRKFYEVGVKNESGKLQKVNLDMAAGLVGLSRKTLDDYYKYIRKAEDLNFDFKGRSEEKIGVLRNFVRDKSNRGTKQEDTTDSQQNSPEELAAAGTIGADDDFEDAVDDHTFKQSKNSIISNNHQEITPAAVIAAAAAAVIKVEENIKNSLLAERISTPQPAAQLPTARDLLPPPPYEHELQWLQDALMKRRITQSAAPSAEAAAAASATASSMEIEPEQIQSHQSQEFLSNRFNLLKKGTLHQQQSNYANNSNASNDQQNVQQYFAYPAAEAIQENVQQSEGAYSPDEDFDYLNSDTEMRKNEQED